MTTETLQKADAILGSPFSGDLPENAIKVRRNLLIASLIILVLIITGAKVHPDSTLMGVRFTDLKVEHIPYGLLILNLYFFIHYLWYAVEAFLEWRLRLTGTKVVYQTAAKFASELGDYPSDPRQSTLYNWWKNQARQIRLLKAPLDEIQRKITSFEKTIDKLTPDEGGMNYVNATSTLASIKNDVAKLDRQLKGACDTIKSDRINASLERFDNWFRLILRTQSLRWILIDITFPIIVGTISIAALLREISLA